LDKALVYVEFLLFFTEFVSNCVSKACNPAVTSHFCKEFFALPRMMAQLNQTTIQVLATLSNEALEKPHQAWLFARCCV